MLSYLSLRFIVLSSPFPTRPFRSLTVVRSISLNPLSRNGNCLFLPPTLCEFLAKAPPPDIECKLVCQKRGLFAPAQNLPFPEC